MQCDLQANSSEYQGLSQKLTLREKCPNTKSRGNSRSVKKSELINDRENIVAYWE